MKLNILLAILVTLPTHGQDAVLDLTQLESYADQDIPPYIQKDNTPLNNLSSVVLSASPSVDAGSGQVSVVTRGVPNVTYLPETSADMKEWSNGIPVAADATGVVRYTLPEGSADRFFTYTYVVPAGEAE